MQEKIDRKRHKERKKKGEEKRIVVCLPQIPPDPPSLQTAAPPAPGRSAPRCRGWWGLGRCQLSQGQLTPPHLLFDGEITLDLSLSNKYYHTVTVIWLIYC